VSTEARHADEAAAATLHARDRHAEGAHGGSVPYQGSLPTAVPTDPLIYRWYEIVNVYGTTIKELIHEEFGDGIMSTIDFSMDITREPDPKGDRVNLVLSGKFLPYKTY
jgi:cyanate lyase